MQWRKKWQLMEDPVPKLDLGLQNIKDSHWGNWPMTHFQRLHYPLLGPAPWTGKLCPKAQPRIFCKHLSFLNRKVKKGLLDSNKFWAVNLTQRNNRFYILGQEEELNSYNIHTTYETPSYNIVPTRANWISWNNLLVNPVKYIHGQVLII